MRAGSPQGLYPNWLSPVLAVRPALPRELPDLCADLWLAPHFRTGLDVEGVVELLEVDVRADGAELTWTVRIDCDQAAGFGFANVGAPDLGERDEETLFGGEAIDVLSLR